MKKKYYITTFGCQMNEHDSEIISGILEHMDYDRVDEPQHADVILVNTCCIREKAESKVLSFLGEMKAYAKKNPRLIVGVCGCMAQQKNILPIINKAAPHVNLVFGTHNILYLQYYIDEILRTGHPVYRIFEEEESVAGIVDSARKYPFKALVNIVFGCNNFCTYCIVPYVRGRERSRPYQDIIEEITILANDGVVEITLLGQNVNSYGKDLTNGCNFAELLRKIEQIEGIELIRYLTSHPKDLSDDLIDVVANSSKISKHFHLPIQSGSNSVLARMNRKYTREHYLDIIKKIRAKIPEASITTDIIVGFPNETESEFLETLDMVNQVSYDNAFSFIYSKRKGTPAESFLDSVDITTKKERLQRLNTLLAEHSYKNNLKLQGQKIKVLVEGINNQNSILTGRTDTFKIVNFEGPRDLVGKFVDVKILKAKSWSLEGKIVT
jgi:tRNA-i(6)A37 thiotransferase enzyme miaB